ncbi:MAG: WecB/TagA/CpsF family glycosyltransferase [Tepidisphaeraceae bacterium]
MLADPSVDSSVVGMPAPLAAAAPSPRLNPADTIPNAASSPTIAKPALKLREPLPVVRLTGVDLHSVTEQQAIDHILNELNHGYGGVVVTPNLDHLRRCRSDMNFAALVSETELVVPDGMPLIWASRLQGTPLPQRVAGSDLILSLSGAAAKAGRSIYLLGGAPGTAEGAAEVLRSRYPGIKVVGTYCPPMGFDSDSTQMAKIVDSLQQAKPDIVFVALGSPKQEFLIERIRTTLPQAWWLGVGVSFSFLTGHVQRAPRWVQKIGMEWVHRLVQEPKRLFKRYVMQGLPFACVMVADALFGRVRKWTGDGRTRSYRRPDRRAARLANLAGVPIDLQLTNNENGATPEETVALLDQAILGREGALAHTNNVATAYAIHALEAPPHRSPRTPTVISRVGNAHSGQAISRLKAVVLLAGQLRPSPLALGVERSVLDLPLLEDRSLLNHWLTDITDLGERAKLSSLPVHLLITRPGDEPTSIHTRFRARLSVTKDSGEYRGTGGVVSDLARSLDDDDFILVASGMQVLLEPLPVLATALDHKRGDVALVSHLDGTPGGMMLMRCKALKGIAPVGFVDMKEQAMPNIAKNFDVRVVHCRRPTGLPLRTASDYIGALRQYHRGPGRLPGSRRGQIDPLAEDFSRGFALVEPGAYVDATAYLHDTVILRGAKVEAGAAVVRSLVGPRATVKRDARVIDDFRTI